MRLSSKNSLPSSMEIKTQNLKIKLLKFWVMLKILLSINMERFDSFIPFGLAMRKLWSPAFSSKKNLSFHNFSTYVELWSCTGMLWRR